MLYAEGNLNSVQLSWRGMEYPGVILRSLKKGRSQSYFLTFNIRPDKWIRKDVMRKKYIQSGKFYVLSVIGLLFGFWKFFFQIAFSFAGRLRNISFFTQIFRNIFIIHGIIDQRQYRTQCNGENNKYGNEKFQPGVLFQQIYYWKLFYSDFMMKVISGNTYLHAKIPHKVRKH